MRRILYGIFMLLLTLSMSAAPRSRQQALAIAQKLAGHISTIVAPEGVTVALARQNVTDNGTEAYYVFNNGSDNGYMIISGEDRLPALIGYTDNGEFDADNLPVQLKEFLSQYVALVDSVEGGRITLADGVTGDEGEGGSIITPVEALLGNTAWNQDDPFNQQCPQIDGERCVTGCGPTAVAQIMRYWKYPLAQPKDIPSYTSGGVTYDAITLSATAEENAYDWDNMLGQYTSSATQNQKDAVAKLMNHVGHVMQASYGLSSSIGTSTTYGALKDAFTFYGYDSSLLQRLDKDQFSYAEWKTMITNEISHKRPVLYGGQAGPYGHAFVLDGYDSHGLYHVNWGWGGQNNGYFDVTILNPYDNTGIGASTSTDGYNGNAIIIVGITTRKDAGEKPYSTSGTKPTTSTDNLTFKVTYKDGATTLYRCGSYDYHNTVVLTVTNNGSNEYYGSTYVVTSESSSTTATIYDTKYISVPARETVTYDIDFSISSSSTATKYYVTAFGKQFTFVVTSVDAPKLTITGITSTASENDLTPTVFDNISGTPTLMVPTLKSNSITYTVTIKNEGGYYCGEDIYVGYLNRSDNNFWGNTQKLEIPAGESASFEFTDNTITIGDFTGIYLWTNTKDILTEEVTQKLLAPNSTTSYSFWGAFYAYVAGPATNVNVTSANYSSNDNAYYSSLYLDYAVQLPTGVTAYTATYDKATSNVTLTRIDDGIVPANTGVILRLDNNENYELTPVTTAETASSDLKGYTVDTPVFGNLSSTPYVLSIYDGKPALQAYSGDYLRANKAYLVLPSSARSFTMNFKDDDVTGIEEIKNEKIKVQNSACYNLRGQRVKADAKGIIIVGGKKVVR